MCQSIVDRCILDKCYEFLVHNLPCSYPDEHSRHSSRKRKISNTEDIGSTFLTPAVTQSSSIPLHHSSSDDQSSEGRNYNFNNSNPLWKTFLSMKQQHGASGSRSGTPSPIALLERKLAQEGVLPAVKKTLLSAMAETSSGSLPKVGRPRSKSTVDKPKKRVGRLRSKSSDQPNKTQANSGGVPISIALNSNSNNSNNNNNSGGVETSPPGLFTIPQAHFRPLPITPPRNPFEDQATNERLDPKTLRHLQRRFSQL